MSAIFSPCGRYRYRLDRVFNQLGRTFGFCGVNPSTAGDERNDQTIRKDIGFTTRWGGTHLIKFNVFGYVATDVRELKRVDDPYGPDQERHLTEILAACDVLVPCWGNRNKLPAHLRPALRRMTERLRDSGKPVMVLGYTASGDPLHPLFLPYTTSLRSMYP